MTIVAPGFTIGPPPRKTAKGAGMSYAAIAISYLCRRADTGLLARIESRPHVCSDLGKEGLPVGFLEDIRTVGSPVIRGEGGK
jgi:hypothetical protein